jgi:hypothetical protein
LEKNLENHRNKMTETLNQLEASKTQFSKPFEQEQELHTVLTELANINALLSVDRTEDADVVLSETVDGKKAVIEIDCEEAELEQ